MNAGLELSWKAMNDPNYSVVRDRSNTMTWWVIAAVVAIIIVVCGLADASRMTDQPPNPVVVFLRILALSVQRFAPQPVKEAGAVYRAASRFPTRRRQLCKVEFQCCFRSQASSVVAVCRATSAV